MAVQPYSKIETKWYGYPAILYRWTLAVNDTGTPARIPAHSDVTCQVRGTIASGAGAVTFEGTLDDTLSPPDASFGTLHKPDMSTASISVVGGLVQILEHPLQIRPHSTSGDGGTNAICDILVLKQWKE